MLEIDPDDGLARHMRAALTGGTLEAAPRDYVERLFDQYAERFERHLVAALDYRTPALIREMIGETFPGRRFARALDLGCGTGLSGAALRDLAETLEGVDLSRNMVEEARKKGVYDELAVADLVEFLAAAEQAWDLVAAADVFVYIGDLAPIFAAVRARAAPGAVFAFSVEAGEAPYVLNDTGRYAHSAAYVETLASDHGFAVVARREASLRKQHGEPVAGHLFALTAPPA